ncbi:AAA family ATPase [Micromonospora sp. DR5-3]|uniref:HelD family protein n=1 Tax=unclassified Micromonospora TaxID=2617518 RepID=UPI0011D54209|nr:MULTISPECIES: UvrD-helicase domain-containing protein [unclassified Micromonospora]MCW3814610.1 AAA family ATPase [Micromonospora sp. DR5-3]TYC23304.1 AAA family ATPase [Micromonospora sp. MP36]
MSEAEQQIAIEQQVVDKVYARLEVMREQAKELKEEGHSRATSGPLTGLVERDAMVLRAAARMSDLDGQEEGIVFGRLDFDDGYTYRVGRLGVRDEDREPLVVDWRAPAAAPFYRATPGEPLGVERRRVITCAGPKVIGLDDDVLTEEDIEGVVGEGALLASLTRERGEHMRDIVTTIQREQDEAIRAPAHGVTLITGGPGTGKTQVALHRAAYLLYSDRGKFADGRVLVVGPSTVFTEYIGRVLPGLGEGSVHLRAIGELFEGVVATRRDSAEVARSKGDLKMVRVLTELAWDTPPNAPDRLSTLNADDLAKARLEIRKRCEAKGVKPNGARAEAAKVLSELLNGREIPDAFLNAWWPSLTPQDVLPAQDGEWSVDDVPLLDELAEILGRPEKATPKMPEWQARELSSGVRLAETFVLSWSLNDGWQLFAPGLSTPIAQSGQSIDHNGYWAAQRWASGILLREGHKVTSWIDGFDPYGEEGYVPVLAEPLPVAEAEEPVEDVYLHVILDEAQDLSPMECRMIARRAAHASMTIVGDLGQATHPLAAESWSELVQRLGKREVRTLDLPTGYRVPQVIADFAALALAPGIEPTRSFRPGGRLEIRQVDDLAAAVAQESGAVIAPDHLAASLNALPVSQVKGLEYDRVVLVEPADIVAAEPRGMNRLYVALTRAVAELVILHTKPLPFTRP